MRFHHQAKLLKDIRQVIGFSQRDVSEKCGYSSPQIISNIERRTCAAPPKVLKFMSKYCSKEEMLNAMDEDYCFEVDNLIKKIYGRKK